MKRLLKLKRVAARLRAHSRRWLPFRRVGCGSLFPHLCGEALPHYRAGLKGTESGKARSIAQALLAGGMLNRRNGERRVWMRRRQLRAPSRTGDDSGQPQQRALARVA